MPDPNHDFSREPIFTLADPTPLDIHDDLDLLHWYYTGMADLGEYLARHLAFTIYCERNS